VIIFIIKNSQRIYVSEDFSAAMRSFHFALVKRAVDAIEFKTESQPRRSLESHETPYELIKQFYLVIL